MNGADVETSRLRFCLDRLRPCGNGCLRGENVLGRDVRDQFFGSAFFVHRMGGGKDICHGIYVGVCGRGNIRTVSRQGRAFGKVVNNGFSYLTADGRSGDHPVSVLCVKRSFVSYVSRCRLHRSKGSLGLMCMSARKAFARKRVELLHLVLSGGRMGRLQDVFSGSGRKRGCAL